MCARDQYNGPYGQDYAGLTHHPRSDDNQISNSLSVLQCAISAFL